MSMMNAAISSASLRLSDKFGIEACGNSRNETSMSEVTISLAAMDANGGAPLCLATDAGPLRDVLSAVSSVDGTVDAVRIDVVDSGIGIPPDQLTAIFEPFRQVDGDRAVLGTGLGLAIAQRLALLMHGTLTVESTLGSGSTFMLTVPPSAPPERTDALETGQESADAGYLHASSSRW